MTDITNPHDRFFKEVFSRPEVAEDFLLHFLPPHISDLLQPNTFRLHKDSFVDVNLQEYFSDLLYQVDFREGESGLAYILFEHKSYPAPDIAFQLLRYMTRIWEYSYKQEGGSLPPIIPVVLYHGADEWRIPLNFASLYRSPASLKEILWDFRYYLCDLSAYSDGEIKMEAMTTVALLLLKNIHSKTLVERLTDVFRLLQVMNEQTALEFLETILRYLGAATQTVTAEDCRKAIKAALTDTGDNYMDRISEELVAEHRQKWIEVGIKEGIREGTREGAASLTIRQLMRKFGALDNTLQERVRQLSVEELEKLGVDLLDFPDEAALTAWFDTFGKSH